MDEKEAAVLYKKICRFAIAFPGLILDKADIKACMADKDIRAYYGNVLYYEVMPTSHAEKEAAEAAALEATRSLEQDAAKLTDFIAIGTEALEDVIDFIRGFEKDQELLPLGLCFALTAFVLCMAGIRRRDDGFEMIIDGKPQRVDVPEEVGSAFYRLSVDMPSESLAYAALSDVSLMGSDLRTLPGLEEKITDLIRSVQLTGFLKTMKGLDIKGQW